MTTDLRTNRAVTVRCTRCGLEVVGVLSHDGTVRPHDKARPPLGDKPRPGLCWTCYVTHGRQS